MESQSGSAVEMGAPDLPSTMEPFTRLILSIHDATHPTVFFLFCLGVSLILCLVAIPWTSSLMVNNAAGLASRWMGPSSRALVINASTNNPEAFSMAVSLGIGRMGGWANPLGSLLANCYLMYGLGILYVMGRFLVLGKTAELKQFVALLSRERKLVLWHLGMALGMFAGGTLVLRLMGFGARATEEGTRVPTPGLPSVGWPLVVAIGILVLCLIVFLGSDRRLKRVRPELFHDITDDHHRESLFGFLSGTAGLIASCYVMNSLFLAGSILYGDRLESWIGLGAFGALHYFLGALITSLPELKVATENYKRLTAPDLNTALGSASYSNLINVGIALIGLLIFAVLHLLGRTLSW